MHPQVQLIMKSMPDTFKHAQKAMTSMPDAPTLQQNNEFDVRCTRNAKITRSAPDTPKALTNA
jgi:hypothetical protein